jgi:hypothetical protein
MLVHISIADHFGHCQRKSHPTGVRLILLVFLIYPQFTSSFEMYNCDFFHVKLANARSPGWKGKHTLIDRGSDFRIAKSQLTMSLFVWSKDVEVALSVNKNLARSPIRRLWTFYIAPCLTATAVLGSFIAVILEQVDEKHHPSTFIDYILQLAKFAFVLHSLSGLLAFKVAVERDLQNPLEYGAKGFISGFVVLADVLETNSKTG